MSILGNTPENNTQDEITSDTKKRIVFPDGVSIPIDNIDEDSIKYLQTKFYRYIYNRDYEGLKEIKVLDEKQDYTNIIESLKKTLNDNQFKMTQKLLFKLVNEYLRDFLKISGSRLDIDFPDIAGIVSDIESISKHESPMVESTGETSTQEPPKDALIPTFCGAFPKGKKIFFWGKKKIGKTPIAIAVTSNEIFMNPVIFALDDDEDQHKLYRRMLGNKGCIITLEELDRRKEKIKQYFRGQLTREVMLEEGIYPWLEKYNVFGKDIHTMATILFDSAKIQRKVNTRLNHELNEKNIDRIYAIESILEEKNSERKIDLFIVDSLLSISDNSSRKMKGDSASRLLKMAKQYDGLTFILIHHEDDLGKKMIGQSATSNSYNTEYRLELVRNEKEAAILKITSKSHFEEPNKVRFIRRTFKDGIPTHVPIDETETPGISAVPQGNNVSVPGAIMKLVANDEVIGFTELCEGINKICNKEMNKGNIYKQLKILEEEKHLIMRANGKNWEGGIKKHKEL